MTPSPPPALAPSPPVIVVSLPKRQLTLFRHGQKPLRFKVSIGEQGLATPSGTFKIEGKYPGWRGADGKGWGYGVMTLNVKQRGPGGLPIAIHGARQPWTIGGRTSAGCIVVRNRPLKRLFQLVPNGTRVVVRGMNG